jgi:DNA-directed RNA polymerase subunit beta'
VKYPGPGRGQDADRAGRRGHRHRPARRHRVSRHRRKKKEDLRPRITLLGEDEEGEETEAARYMLAPGAISRSRTASGRGRRHARPRRAKPPRRATSPAVCRGWPSCSRRASPRTMRSSPRSPAGSNSFADYKAKRKIAIIPEEGRSGRVSGAQDQGDRRAGRRLRQAGDNLIGGSPDPHDILEVLGVEALAEYLVSRSRKSIGSRA